MERVVGRIGRAHGLRGEITVEVRTDVPDERFVPGAQFATDPAAAGPLRLLEAREHSGTLLLRFAAVDDRSAAEALRGVLLLVSTDASVEDDAWYEDELVGLRVRGQDGEDLGEVAGLDTGGAQDLLVVRRGTGPNVLVPFVRAIVPVVDVAAGFVVVDPPGGLFDPENAIEDH